MVNRNPQEVKMKWTNNPGSISNGGGQLCRKSPSLKYVQAETMRSSLQSKSCSLWNPILKPLATGYCKCMNLNEGINIKSLSHTSHTSSVQWPRATNIDHIVHRSRTFVSLQKCTLDSSIREPMTKTTLPGQA